MFRSGRHAIPAIVMSLCINGMGVARALGSNGVKVIGINDGRSLPGLNSRYVNDIWFCDGGDEALVDLLIKRGKSFSERPVIFPITDTGVRCIAKRMDEVTRYYRIGLPELALVESTMSKRGIAEWMEKLRLPAPQTTFIKDSGKIDNVARTMKYPCIIKPDFRTTEFAKAAGKKAHRAENAQDLTNFYLSFSHVDPRAIIQQWIPGGDGDVFFCLQYYDSKSIPLVSFTGKKIRQWPPLCGGTASCEPVDCIEIAELSTRFFKSIGFRGLCSMEFKKNPATGEFFIVEPTIGRTDWQSDIATINGVPIPYIAYRDLIGLKHKNFAQTQKSYKWVRWFSDKQSASYYRNNGDLTLFQWLNSIRPPVSGAVWAWKDPKPFLCSISQKLFRKIRKII